MAKAPVAGRVKTRLCPPFLPAEAAELAAAAIADTLAAACAAVPLAARRGFQLEPVLVLDGTPDGRLRHFLQEDIEGPMPAARGCPTRRSARFPFCGSLRGRGR